MKVLVTAVLAGALVMGAALADDTTKKVGQGAENTGKTVTHGTTSVGKGASKIYHEAAKGVHKVIAKNAGNKKTEQKHMQKAGKHDVYAHEKAAQSKKEMKKAEKSSDQVGK